MQTNHLKGIVLLLSLMIFASCSRFQQLMKSNDMEAKYEAAVKYYEKKDYYHALQLFEELIAVYRGTTKAEQAYYYYTYCTYYVDDYIMAAYHFNNFVQSYPSSRHAEEMQFMYAYCYYLDSPVSSLDQTSTFDAIEKFQIFTNRYPESPKVQEANTYMDELRLKLEEKSFQNAKLYYRTENYKAAWMSLNNFRKDFPYSRHAEEAAYLSLRSAYLYADNSIELKRPERFRIASEEYLRLIDQFPQSRYLRDAERIYEAIRQNLEANVQSSAGPNP